MNCDHCEAVMINGVFCHETGCPVAWCDEVRACRLCGDRFKPDHDRADACADCANDDQPDPIDDDRDQSNPCEYSNGHDFAGHDWDADPDWR